MRSTTTVNAGNPDNWGTWDGARFARGSNRLRLPSKNEERAHFSWGDFLPSNIS